MANPMSAAQRTNDLLFTLLAEYMEEFSGIKPTAEQVETNIQQRLKEDKDTVAAAAQAKQATARKK